MKQHIILTSNAYFPNLGGIENSLYYLAKEFQAKDIEVDIVVSDANGMTSAILPDFEVHKGIRIHRYRATSRLPLMKGLSAFLSLRRILKTLNQPNTIGAISRFHHTTWMAKLAGIKKVCYLVPGIVVHQDSHRNTSAVSGLQKLKQKLRVGSHASSQWFAFYTADDVRVFSQNMLAQLYEFAGRRVGEVNITKPGVDVDRFKPLSSSEKSALREQLGYAKDAKIVLGVGRVVRAKGFHYVVDAMRYLPEHTFVLVGDGGQKAELNELVRKHGLEGRVKFHAAVDEPLPFYQIADVFVMSSTYEPLGQTILEALSVGLPIVAFDEAIVKETATFELLGNLHATYCQKLEGQALAESIREACINVKTAEGVESNRAYAKANFSWKTLAENLLGGLQSR
ncbi:Lipopolysaccharide core biosynthesis glycosyltransferase lpsE [Pseudoalteromonas luteoviolacea B = ATCC 29581]|nr:Lipopolysaccharide core biosynthesis glycosyltransferase lpsE [Pseudoalteromonas luteoviolacea B = ATCC 29581]